MALPKLFNPMSVDDVRIDTDYHISRDKVSSATRAKKTRAVAYVIAKKRCGCEGPYLGTLYEVENVNRARTLKGHPEVPDIRPGVSAKLWSVHVNGSGSKGKPLMYVWGMENAAKRLRDHWATRNINRVMAVADRRRAAVASTDRRRVA